MQKPGIVVLSLLLAFNLQTARANESKSKGAELVDKGGCLHCHFIKGDGGLIGPPLDGIAKYRSESEIVATLTGTRAVPDDFPRGVLDPREFMKHMRLGKESAHEIAKYLLSLSPPEEQLTAKGHGAEHNEALPEGFKYEPRPGSPSSRKGLQLYKDSGCAACHSIEGTGGRIGPSLDGVGARRSRDYIESRISEGAIAIFNGREYKPTQYSMPPAELSQSEIKNIIDFLYTLPTKRKGK